MNKLSKEQSSFLIGNIDIDFLSSVDSEYALKEIMKVINQCTEKEFPGFELEYPNGNISISKNDSRINIGYVDRLGGLCACGNLYIPKEQFKQFTQGCISICQWLEEQE